MLSSFVIFLIENSVIGSNSTCTDRHKRISKYYGQSAEKKKNQNIVNEYFTNNTIR